MNNNNNKRKEVEFKDSEGNVTKIFIQKPSSKVLSEAQHVSAKVWTECVRDKIMTKQELRNFMYQNNIWNSGKDAQQLALTSKINDLEKKLYVGGNQQYMKISEAKELAIQMRIARMELRDLIAEKMSLEQNTAEALADNAKFDYLVSRCTYNSNGQPVYSSLDDYNERADDELAIAAATAMAETLYSLDKDFESKLPENKFLIDQKLVNDDLSLINKDGETVDTQGRKINEFGHYINNDGKRVDIDGNLLDENGNYIPAVKYINDDEDEVIAEPPKEKIKTTRRTKPASKVQKEEVASDS